MISLVSIVLNTVLSFIINILKAVFSMLLWFIKAFTKALKLFFCALPITSMIFFLLMVINLLILVIGNPYILSLIPKVFGISFLSPDKNTALLTADALKLWWASNVYVYHGQGSYIPLLFLTAIMFIPVVSIFLSFSVLTSYGSLLFVAIAGDAIIYLLRALFSKSFLAQFQDRYYFLFPDAGKRHYEKSYNKWLRKHHEEFEEEAYEKSPDRSRYDDFYEDYEDEGYDPDFDDEENEDYAPDYDDEGNEDYDPDYDDEYYEEDDESEFYEDEYDPDFDEDEENEEFEEHDESDAMTAKTTFDFFAGCTSRESVEKKYRSLAKLYHPDNMDGDTAALQEINAQYEQAKIRFPR